VILSLLNLARVPAHPVGDVLVREPVTEKWALCVSGLALIV